MIKCNAANAHVKRRYMPYLKDAKGCGEESIDAVAGGLPEEAKAQVNVAASKWMTRAMRVNSLLGLPKNPCGEPARGIRSDARDLRHAVSRKGRVKSGSEVFASSEPTRELPMAPKDAEGEVQRRAAALEPELEQVAKAHLEEAQKPESVRIEGFILAAELENARAALNAAPVAEPPHTASPICNFVASYKRAWDAYLARSGDDESAFRASLARAVASAEGTSLKEPLNVSAAENRMPDIQGEPANLEAAKPSSSSTSTASSSLIPTFKAIDNPSPIQNVSPDLGESKVAGEAVANEVSENERGGAEVRGRAREVPESEPPAPAPEPKPIGQTPSTTDLGGGGSGGDDAHRNVEEDRRDQGLAPAGTGETVTGPPRGSDGTDTPRPDPSTDPAAAGRIAARQKIAERSRANYRITDADAIGEGGPKGKIRANIEAIKTLKLIEDEAREATDEEKAKLVKYVGWGAFSEKMFNAARQDEFRAERKAFRAIVTSLSITQSPSRKFSRNRIEAHDQM